MAVSGGGGGASFGSGGLASGSGVKVNGLSGSLDSGGSGRLARDVDSGVFVTIDAEAKGGNGGNLGQNGTPGTTPNSGVTVGAGGAAGNAVVGDALVTWTTLGDVRGNRV